MQARDGVGELIRRVRLRQRWSQATLADRVVHVSGDRAVTPDRVRRWEAGTEVPADYRLGWLAMGLGIPRAELEQALAVTRGRRGTRGRTGARSGHF